MGKTTITFGQRLRDLRQARGLTMQELADRACICLDALSRLERGKRRPMLDTAQRLAKALGVSVEAFVEDRP